MRWLAVWGWTDEPEPRVGMFLVPRPAADTPGIRVIESWDHLGLRASCTPPDATRLGPMKFSVTNNAIEAVGLALKLTGNQGLSRHNPLERHHRDILCGRIHTPQDDATS